MLQVKKKIYDDVGDQKNIYHYFQYIYIYIYIYTPVFKKVFIQRDI